MYVVFTRDIDCSKSSQDPTLSENFSDVHSPFDNEDKNDLLNIYIFRYPTDKINYNVPPDTWGLTISTTLKNKIQYRHSYQPRARVSRIAMMQCISNIFFYC
jgi:hypothetical protein